MKKYRTGYHCTDYDYLLDLGNAYKKEGERLSQWMSKDVLSGNGWSIAFQKVKDDRSFERAKEAVVCASSSIEAQKASNLICSAQYLLNGTDIFGADPNQVIPIGKTDELDEHELQWIVHNKRQSDDVPKCCAIAAKASLNLDAENALSKYQLSCSLFSTHYMDVDTFNDEEAPLSPYAYDHVRLAYAVVIAYSIIEELNLEVRVRDVEKIIEEDGTKIIKKEKESSRLPNGDWNPSVKQDLEQRLLTAGINLAEKFHWTVRGAETPLEKKRSPKLVSRTSSTSGNIRDGQIEVIDAINYVSWLRSKVSSHKISDRAKSLTVFEVFNTQLLARRLLLEKLGFWRAT